MPRIVPKLSQLYPKTSRSEDSGADTHGVRRDAVNRGPDGTLRVRYDKGRGEIPELRSMVEPGRRTRLSGAGQPGGVHTH